MRNYFNLIGIFILLLTITSSCKKEAIPGDSRIRYYVYCDDCNVSYKNEHDSLLFITHIMSSWEYGFKGHAGEKLYLSATKNSTSGPFTVLIYQGINILQMDQKSGTADSAVTSVVMQ